MIQKKITLKLVGHTRSAHNLTIFYLYNEITFVTTLWYSSLNFHDLEKEYGANFMGKVYFHIILFHCLKIQSLKPSHLDLGAYSKYWTSRLNDLWRKCTVNCLSQWRQETNNMDYRGAAVEFSDVEHTSSVSPVLFEDESNKIIVGNGGGKDSFLMMSLLERNGVSFDTFSINFHTHANPEAQLELNESILEGLNIPPEKNFRQYIFESFLNSPSAELHGVNNLEIQHIRNDEDLPNGHGIISLLPVFLAGKYKNICFGNERSAESENVVIDGERVNHAWSKTIECEVLFENYVASEFIKGFKIFSFLKPFSDVAIYVLLNSILKEGDVNRMYSCNLDPPWCKKCPKCAYVWLSYCAYLSDDHSEEISLTFGGENLFDRDDLQIYFRQLLGFQEFKPFECVGEIEETKLAFEICLRKEQAGKAIDFYRNYERIDNNEFEFLKNKYLAIDNTYKRLPDNLFEILNIEFKKATESKEVL